MTSYTDEQLKYINYDKKENTKLLACAGSGKTRCIIARMNRLIEEKIYDADSILMLTFSRFTRDDFMNKIKSYKGTCKIPEESSPVLPNPEDLQGTCKIPKESSPALSNPEGLQGTSININSVKTIDKFAKQIIDPNGTVDVSLLSYRLMKFLEETDESELKKNIILKQIKMVFVDEAQDLNEIQYKIICAMNTKLNIIINMIGDPNQNIYQFRDSSDKYLTEFQAEVFKLTRNFRSHLSIVDFSKHLRPFNEHDVICTKGTNNCKPIMMFYEDEKILEENIIDLLEAAQEKNIDLSEFAILSPTRGRMRGRGKSHGLCFISNILYKAKIKFKQFYEESTDEISGEGIKYEPEKGHVNILTYMGSKGLEWNYVIIIDADACLINKRNFDENKHNHDRYLLYVACSRAIHNMYIFSKCTYKQGEFHFLTNPWFEYVPDDLYDIDDRFSDNFFFPKLTYRQYSESDNRLGKLIDKLNCYNLDQISELLNFNSRTIKSEHKIFKSDYSMMEKPSAIFLSKYSEALFHALYNIKLNRPHVPFTDIEYILEGDNIVTGLSDETVEWYNKNKKIMTWKSFDASGSIQSQIKESINKSFDRKKEFNTHIIAINGYYQHFILEQKIWIKNLYKKYLKCKNSSQIREILFYLMVIKHSIDTQHYFHIKSKGKKYEHILTDFKDLFDDIEQYVDETDHNFISNNHIVTRWNIISRVDMIDTKENVWTIKCSGEISLKHTLHSLISTLMYNTKLINDDFSIDIMLNSNSKSDSKSTIDTQSDIKTKVKKIRKSKKNIIELIKEPEPYLDIDINYINFIKGEEISYTYKISLDNIKKIISIINPVNNNQSTDNQIII